MSFCNTSVAYCYLDRVYYEKIDDTKCVGGSRKSKIREYKDQNKRKQTQKDKQWSTKHYKENYKYTWLSMPMTELWKEMPIMTSIINFEK